MKEIVLISVIIIGSINLAIPKGNQSLAYKGIVRIVLNK